jgi:hypothetical protein
MTFVPEYINTTHSSIDGGTTSDTMLREFDCGLASDSWMVPIYDFGTTAALLGELARETLLTSVQKVNRNLESIYTVFAGYSTGLPLFITELDGGDIG